MKIDIERLKTDRGYWDSVAPEGANIYAVGSIAPWERKNIDGSVDYWSQVAGEWGFLFKHYSSLDKELVRARITRPEKQWRGPEDGLPPEKSTVEYQGRHVVVELLDRVYNQFCARFPNGEIAILNPGWCRPIPSPRDEWVDKLHEILGISPTDATREWIGQTYDALLSGDLPVPGVEYD